MPTGHLRKRCRQNKNEGVPVRYPGTARLVQRAHEHRSARCIKMLVRGLVSLPVRTTELPYRAVSISPLVIEIN